jgi:hypothetical protein
VGFNSEDVQIVLDEQRRTLQVNTKAKAQSVYIIRASETSATAIVDGRNLGAAELSALICAAIRS